MKKILISIFCISMFYSAQSQIIDTLINVGGHRLHFNITKGKGIPILFESGGGEDCTVWNDLRKRLKESIGTTLITYERAGFGKSEIDTTRIDILNEVIDLETGLKKLGYSKDIFIVSSSLGASYCILFSSRNENRIKGCVFIDGVFPCFMTKLKAKERKESLRKLDKQKYIGHYYIRENYEKTHDLLRVTTFPPNIPATIISSDIPPFIGKGGVDSIQWKNCQKSFGLLLNHTYVLAEKCHHNVFKDNPVLVTNEIIKKYRRKEKRTI